MKFWTKSLMSRLVGYFSLLSLVTVSGVGAIAFVRARVTIQKLVFDRLEVTATLKEEALNLWIENQRHATISLAQLPEILTRARVLLTRDESTDEFVRAYALMEQYMASALAGRSELQEVFILRRIGGKIIFSTNRQREGEYRVKDKYFTEGLAKTFVQTIYLSPLTGKPTMTVSTPLRGQNGKLLGVLAAHLNLDKMDDLVLDRTSLGKSGETYLVDHFRLFVSAERFGREEFPRTLHTEGVNAALQEKDGQGLYLNYAQIPVIGVYRWLDEWELVLLVEMQQQEALAPARELAWTIFIVGFTSAGLLTVGVYLLARQISRPILAITNTAIKVADGDLTPVAPVLTEDEVGMLAKAFNQMTKQLRRLYTSFEEKVAQLQQVEASLRDSLEQLQVEKEKVDDRTRQLSAANQEITILNQRLQSENHDLAAELQAINKQLTQFLEAMPVGVLVVDKGGQPHYINSRARELLGRGIVENATAEQLRTVYRLDLAGGEQVYPSDRDPVQQALRGESVTVDDLEIRQGSRVIPIEAWGTPIFDDRGNIVYAIVAFQDITERKRAEAERQSFIEDLFEVNCNLEISLDAEVTLTDAYGRFVPREFLQLLNKNSIVDVSLGDNVQQEMSILFADIRNFTNLSERMTPEDNFRFINAYLSRMEPAILENNGFIDKYIGDAIMALFSGGADDAVKAGIAMLQRLADYNQTRGRPGRPELKIGIGINTGSLMLGTVGGEKRMDGTVISDAVNLSSRLEGLTKIYGVPLLISDRTFLRLQDPLDYAIRIIDKVKVKGKSERVSVFEVFDADPPSIRSIKWSTKTVFEEALANYYLQNFQDAVQLFEDYLRQNPIDRVAQIYFEQAVKRLFGR